MFYRIDPRTLNCTMSYISATCLIVSRGILSFDIRVQKLGQYKLFWSDRSGRSMGHENLYLSVSCSSELTLCLVAKYIGSFILEQLPRID
jgi:hypothetical protein